MRMGERKIVGVQFFMDDLLAFLRSHGRLSGLTTSGNTAFDLPNDTRVVEVRPPKAPGLPVTVYLESDSLECSQRFAGDIPDVWLDLSPST